MQNCAKLKKNYGFLWVFPYLSNYFTKKSRFFLKNQRFLDLYGKKINEIVRSRYTSYPKKNWSIKKPGLMRSLQLGRPSVWKSSGLGWGLEGLFGTAWHRTPALYERPFKQLRTVFFMRSHVGNWQLAPSNSRVDLEVLEASKKGTDSWTSSGRVFGSFSNARDR